MRDRLAPLRFGEHDPKAVVARRESAVDPARRSEGAERRAHRLETYDGLSDRGTADLLVNLETLTK